MTVLSDYIARMIDGGMQPDDAMQIAAELFAAGVASASARPSAGALRTRKWRHKTSPIVTERHEPETSQSVTERHKASQSDVIAVSPIDTKIKNSKRQNSDRPSRGSRIASDWSPSEADRLIAKQEGFSDNEINREALRFRDYWTGRAGSGGVKLDWPATWRNWIRTSGEKLGKTPIAGTSSGSGSVLFEAKFGSPELDAWDAYARQTKGKSMPRNRDGGWRVPSQWPPGYKPPERTFDMPAPKIQRMDS